MGLTKPDPDGSSGTWDTELNASLDRADIHDHSSGLGVRVPVTGLNINADLPMAGFAISGLKALDLSAISPLTSGYLSSLFVSSADNELYWRTNGGVNIQITSGTTLNAALLGGFIGADYGVGGAQAEFSGSTDIYNFLQAANHRANLDVGNVRLFEPTSGVTTAVKLKSPVGLAASYDWIYPAALPGSTLLLNLSSTGQLAASNTIAGAVTMSSSLSVGTSLAVGTSLTVGTTLGVTGASTVAAVTASGIATLNGETVLAAAERTTGVISPASLSAGTFNNWAPTGIDTARVVRIDHGVGTVNITGISASQTEGRRLTLLNVSANTLVLQDDNASSSAANRILCPGNAGTDDLTFTTNGAVELLYDATSSRWRVVSKSI
jgi:hypothetical protein